MPVTLAGKERGHALPPAGSEPASSPASGSSATPSGLRSSGSPIATASSSNGWATPPCESGTNSHSAEASSDRPAGHFACTVQFPDLRRHESQRSSSGSTPRSSSESMTIVSTVSTDGPSASSGCALRARSALAPRSWRIGYAKASTRVKDMPVSSQSSSTVAPARTRACRSFGRSELRSGVKRAEGRLPPGSGREDVVARVSASAPSSLGVVAEGPPTRLGSGPSGNVAGFVESLAAEVFSPEGSPSPALSVESVAEVSDDSSEADSSPKWPRAAARKSSSRGRASFSPVSAISHSTVSDSVSTPTIAIFRIRSS